MAITDNNTVLVLGAGASAPFGLPLGGALIDKIHSRLETERELYNTHTNPCLASNVPILERIFDCTCLRAFYYYNKEYSEILSNRLFCSSDSDRRSKFFSEIDDILKFLKNQTSDTIDDFIVMNPSCAGLVKSAIAAEFFFRLYEKGDKNGGMRLKDIGQRHLPGRERNWIHRLINLVRLGIENGTVTKDNPVSVITFNYDIILEHVLDQQFANTEHGKERFPDYTDFIKIHHVHGRCGNCLEAEVHDPAKVCAQWAQEIRVIREKGDIPENVSKARETAATLIKQAKEIYFCGFAFARANTELLGLDPEEPVFEKSIHYTNYDNNSGLRMKMNQYRANPGSAVSPGYTVTEYPNIGIADWIGTGALGESP